MINIYTGIGSRKTPPYIQKIMFESAKILAEQGAILRSGGADGADLAFEIGCDSANGKKEIYLPWEGFNNSKSNLCSVMQGALTMAEKFHPAWKNLGYREMLLHARNCYQILGLDLKTPCDIVVCYTENASGKGGTGQALRIAKEYSIPIYDLGDNNVLEKFMKRIKKQ